MKGHGSFEEMRLHRNWNTCINCNGERWVEIKQERVMFCSPYRHCSERVIYHKADLFLGAFFKKSVILHLWLQKYFRALEGARTSASQVSLASDKSPLPWSH